MYHINFAVFLHSVQFWNEAQNSQKFEQDFALEVIFNVMRYINSRFTYLRHGVPIVPHCFFDYSLGGGWSVKQNEWTHASAPLFTAQSWFSAGYWEVLWACGSVTVNIVNDTASRMTTGGLS